MLIDARMDRHREPDISLVGLEVNSADTRMVQGL